MQWVFRPDEPVDDVHARLLELARPHDVGGLVEAGLDLDEGEHLLAGLGRVDERLHDRAVARRAVQRLLDGQHVRVFRGLLEERLHARRERLVRVVHEHVGAADRREDVGPPVLLARLEGERRRRHVRRVVQLGAVDLREIEQPAQVERAGKPVDLLRGDVELADQQVEREVVHVVADLEPDRRPEPAAQQLGLERLDEVLGLVLLDHDVLVAREPERVVIEDLHAGEEVVEVVGDELFEREVAHGVAVARDVHEPREHRRHLEAGELLASGLGVADADREVQRQARDVGERVRGVDGERHQHREDLPLEVLGHPGALVVLELIPRDDLDAGLREVGPHVRGPRVGVPQLQRVRVGGDVGEHLLGRAAHVRGHGEARDDATLEPGDAHHEELVEVAREDREEVRALEHRQRGILGELEHALVEREPAQFAVEVAVVGQLRVEGLGQVEVVVVRVSETRVEHVVFDHPLIIAG